MSPTSQDGNLRHCEHYADWGDDGSEMTCVDCWVTGKLRERHERAEDMRREAAQRGKGRQR